MYKATVENKLTGEAEEVQRLSNPYDALTWLDRTFEEVYSVIKDEITTVPLTVSAYLTMLEGNYICVVYKYGKKEIYNLYLEREKK